MVKKVKLSIISTYKANDNEIISRSSTDGSNNSNED